jgi:hypothetical protein
MRILAVFALALALTGCPNGQTPEQSARDAIAAAHGWVVNAQTVWGTACKADPSPVKCVSTNKLIASEHAAADALLVYCGGAPASGPSYLDGGACVENNSAGSILQAAIVNMNSIATDVQALLKKEGK